MLLHSVIDEGKIFFDLYWFRKNYEALKLIVCPMIVTIIPLFLIFDVN